MKQWNIEVLYLGGAYARKSDLTPNLDDDLLLEIPHLGFLLQADGRNILIDSGGDERYLIDGKFGFQGQEFHCGRSYLDTALEEASVTPDEIDTVIYTHLHNDHAGFSYLFNNARIIVQKKEWEIIHNPLPVMLVRRDYDFEVIPELKKSNLILIDGDLDIADGIKVLATPGHTPGHQSVAVNTVKGVVVVAGDQFPLTCMAFPGMTCMLDRYGKEHSITPAPAVYGPFYPSGIIYNYYDWYNSGYRIKAIIEKNEPYYVIGSHEPSLLFTGV